MDKKILRQSEVRNLENEPEKHVLCVENVFS